MIEFEVNHIVLILSIIGGFVGLATFLYKVLRWIIKINLELESSHKCIFRLERRINGLLGSKGFADAGIT